MDFDNIELAMPIPDFSEYFVTPEGQVFNSLTGREMVLSPTAYGDLTVGLTRDGNQYRRSVKGLVARAFVPGRTERFDTPIQLDGNRDNLNAHNILWRPRWFAVKYVQQFSRPYPDWYSDGPIIDVVDNQRYHTIFEAAMFNGILCKDIYESIHRGDRVFPTGQIFR